MSLSFQILCEETEEEKKNAACLQRGRVLNVKNQDLFGTRGFSSRGEFSHLHRFLDSTFAASFV